MELQEPGLINVLGVLWGGNPAANAAPKEGWAQQEPTGCPHSPTVRATVLVPTLNRVLPGAGSISKPSFTPWIYFHTCLLRVLPELKNQTGWISARLVEESPFICTPSQGHGIQ